MGARGRANDPIVLAAQDTAAVPPSRNVTIRLPLLSPGMTPERRRELHLLRRARDRIDRDFAQIVLSDPRAGRSPDDGEALEELVAKGALAPFVFVTDDLDAAFETAAASGAEVVSEPADQPWGPRDAAFRDPSGNLVRILQAG